MQLLRGFDQAARLGVDSSVATVGFFDGVHLGHERLFDDLREWAVASAAAPVVVTFDCHPQAVLGGHPPVPVVSLEHRLLLLERCGVAATLVLEFDAELAQWPPERFVGEVLKERLRADRLLFGFDSAFGHRRQGTFAYISERAEALGLEVRQSPAVFLGEERISSSLVRRAIADQDLERIGALLGRDVAVLGRVVDGDRRGRTIGFPTANLELGRAAVPRPGVYFASVRLLGALREETGFEHVDPPCLAAVLNIGRRPTFTGAPTARSSDTYDPERDRVEVHILDFSGDLYGRHVEVLIHRKHRDEIRFESVDALVEQITQDVAARRAAD